MSSIDLEFIEQLAKDAVVWGFSEIPTHESARRISRLAAGVHWLVAEVRALQLENKGLKDANAKRTAMLSDLQDVLHSAHHLPEGFEGGQ